MPKVAAKDRDAFVEGRQDEILAAAVRLWAARGFQGTSMAAIAAEVGLAKGTLYLYFPSKDALLDAVLRRYSLRPDVEQLLAAWRDRPLEEVVRTLIRVAWQALESRRELVALLLRELPAHLGKAEHFLTEVLVPTNRLLAAFLDEKLPPARRARIDTLVAGRSLMAMVIFYWVSQEFVGAGRHLPIPTERAFDTLAELFLHGVLGGGPA
jgi:AcrR family transcriptional regulator